MTTNHLCEIVSVDPQEYDVHPINSVENVSGQPGLLNSIKYIPDMLVSAIPSKKKVKDVVGTAEVVPLYI